MIGIEVKRRDVGGLVDRGQAGRLARIHQVERDLGLAVDHHGLAGEGFHVDPMTAAAEGEFDTVMHQAFVVGAGSGTDFVEQRHRTLFKETGADAAEHIVGRVTLQDDVVDAMGAQQLPEQQSRRARANDCYFCPQYLLLPIL